MIISKMMRGQDLDDWVDEKFKPSYDFVDEGQDSMQ
jgi:hypothetical protein